MVFVRWVIAVGILVGVGCSEGTTGTLTLGRRDVGEADVSGVDAGSGAGLDAGRADVRRADASPADAIVADAGAQPDATMPDASTPALCPPVLGPPRLDRVPQACSEAPSDFGAIAQSPRGDFFLELMAVGLETGPSGVATPGAYEVASADRCRLRDFDGRIDEFDTGFPPSRLLILEIEPATYDAIRNGSYEDWDCLNQLHGLQRDPAVQQFGGRFQASVEVEVVADRAAVAAAYEALPGVISAGALFNLPLLEPRIVCAFQRDDGARHYVLTRGSGDCPAGCIRWESWAYRVTDDEVLLEAAYDSAVDPTVPPEVTPPECQP